MIKEFLHIDRNGNKIKISDLKTEHLQNIIAFINRQSINGLLIRHGGGCTADDFWYDEEEIYGKEVLEYMNYHIYKQELEKRHKEKPMPEQKYNNVNFRDNVHEKELCHEAKVYHE